jgi:hypothetical protein
MVCRKSQHRASTVANEWRRWSAATAAMVDAATRESPGIRDLPGDKLDQSLLGGAVTTLDPFSRYLRPGTRDDRIRGEGMSDAHTDAEAMPGVGSLQALAVSGS